MSVQNEMFTVFVEAGKALEELPKVKDELAITINNLDRSGYRINELENQVYDQEIAISDLKAQLEVERSALAQATFRERAAKEAVNAIRSLLVIADVPVAGNSVEVAAPAARIDTPASEPMPVERSTPTEVPTPSVTVDGSIPEVADTSNSGTQGASNGFGGQSEVDPTTLSSKQDTESPYPNSSSDSDDVFTQGSITIRGPLARHINEVNAAWQSEMGPTPSDASLTEALPAKTVSSSDTAPSTEGQREANPTQSVVQSTEGRSMDVTSLDVPPKASADSPSNFYLYPTPTDDFNYAV
jgi:hypothetical protein